MGRHRKNEFRKKRLSKVTIAHVPVPQDSVVLQALPEDETGLCNSKETVTEAEVAVKELITTGQKVVHTEDMDEEDELADGDGSVKSLVIKFCLDAVNPPLGAATLSPGVLNQPLNVANAITVPPVALMLPILYPSVPLVHQHLWL